MNILSNYKLDDKLFFRLGIFFLPSAPFLFALFFLITVIISFIRNKNLQMANAEEVKIKTGYTIGGVSPIGHLVNIKVYMDKHLERFSKVFAAAGHPNAVFGITFIELKKLTNSEVDDLTE